MKEIKLIRREEQEDFNKGGKVYRWFENKNIVASIVEGYFYNEENIRVSFWNELQDLNSFEIRGSKEIIFKMSDEDLINLILRHIKRDIKFKDILEDDNRTRKNNK